MIKVGKVWMADLERKVNEVIQVLRVNQVIHGLVHAAYQAHRDNRVNKATLVEPERQVVLGIQEQKETEEVNALTVDLDLKVIKVKEVLMGEMEMWDQEVLPEHQDIRGHQELMVCQGHQVSQDQR